MVNQVQQCLAQGKYGAIFILTMAVVVVVTIINNAMFYATNHSTEWPLFKREEPNLVGAVCPLTLTNNSGLNTFFFSFIH